MKLKSMFNKMGGSSVAISVLMISAVWAGEYPIIFLPGHMSGWKYWNGTESGHTDYTAMKKIIDQQYGGYTAGSPLNCHENTTLSSTGGNTKKIYNFQYYHIDWYDDKEMGGAIGSNGYCYPDDYYEEIAYINSLTGGSWAQALATFIDKVRTATGATKVDIVTHSMGGLVARAAIKWYGCASKVRKLLMIATPNHGMQGPSPWSNWSQMGVPGWMEGGENQEMDGAVLFYKYSNPGVKKMWTAFLNEGDWAQGVKYATISGNLDPYIVPSNEDGIVDHEWVVLSGADFNPIYIYAAHGSSDGSLLRFTTRGELSLTACTYSCEFIKNWLIDDNTSHNGASSIANAALVPNPWPLAPPYDGPVYVSALLDNFSKALVTQVEMTGSYDDYLVRAFPIYQYTDAYPGLPVLIIDPTQYMEAHYRADIWNYDLGGLINKTEDAPLEIVTGMGPGGFVRIITPNGGESYQPGNTINIQWESNCPCVFQYLFYSTNGGGYWYPIPPSGTPIPANDRSYIWTAPSVSSASCRVKVVFNLDINTPISDMSDGNFSIEPPPSPPAAPSNLHCCTGGANICWNDNSYNEDGFCIWIRINYVWTRLDSVSHNVTYYCDEAKRGAKYWYQVTAYNDYGESSLSNYGYCDQCNPSGGCPYVYTWDGKEFIEDNTILGASERTDSSVTDYYRLEKSLVPQGDKYVLQIREFEHEYSGLDNFELWVVDHSKDVEIAIDQDGKILAYEEVNYPYACVDNQGTDCLGLVGAQDEVYFEGDAGDYLVLTLEGSSPPVQPALVVNVAHKMAYSIEVQIKNGQNWQEIGIIHPRENWSTQLLQLPQFENYVPSFYKARLFWTARYQLDRVGLVKIVQVPLSVYKLPLVDATHSSWGSVLSQLISLDNHYAELVPGAQIELRFDALESPADLVREFILVSKGFYR